MYRKAAAFLALAALALPAACARGGAVSASASDEAAAKTIPLTIRTATGSHTFRVETATTEAEQQRGLMFRPTLPADGGMLFAPYPPGGGAPREASFWMKNTPSPLDIIYIRADGSIARIAENTVPFSEQPIPSGEPVSAILEIRGGRAAELGIGEDDRVIWTAN